MDARVLYSPPPMIRCLRRRKQGDKRENPFPRKSWMTPSPRLADQKGRWFASCSYVFEREANLNKHSEARLAFNILYRESLTSALDCRRRYFEFQSTHS